MQNVAITTARVEIKTLTVSGKQVTLAVFRQLQDQELVHPNGTLLGQPWGTVNYHPDKCANAPAHWHVVWQKDDQLRRNSMPAKPTFDEFWPDEGDGFLSSWLHRLATTGTNTYFPDDKNVGTLTTQRVLRIKTRHGFLAHLSLSPAGMTVADAYLAVQRFTTLVGNSGLDTSAQWATSQLDKAKEELAVALPALAAEVNAFGGTTDELYRDYEAAIEQERARRARHHEVRTLIAQLPQLFIAV